MAYSVPTLAHIALVLVSILIIALAYSSQILFYFIEPGPLSPKDAIQFNFCVLCLWWSYYKTCTVDAAPSGWVTTALPHVVATKKRITAWCKKCQRVKPPRAHHCKLCGTCVPKMDHHCPWTANCVSHTTFPHFLRFIFYAVVSMTILAYHLCHRTTILWNNRHLPAYLGPPVWALLHLIILLVVNGMVLFALTILLSRVLYGLAINVTTIEGWEIERHETLVERSQRNGGYVYAKGGQQIRIRHQEFPYDIGIWKNIKQAMGTKNVWMWLLPFGGSPAADTAAEWEVNGFEDEDKTWPPPDPDKLPYTWHSEDRPVKEHGTVEEQIIAFKKRQQADLLRRGHRRNSNVNRYSSSDFSENHSTHERNTKRETGWINSDGDRLRDYGVDDEDDDEAEKTAGDSLQLRKQFSRKVDD